MYFRTIFTMPFSAHVSIRSKFHSFFHKAVIHFTVMCCIHPGNAHCKLQVAVLHCSALSGVDLWGGRVKTKKPIVWEECPPVPGRLVAIQPVQLSDCSSDALLGIQTQTQLQIRHLKKRPEGMCFFLMKWTTIWIWSADECFLSKLKTMLFWWKAPHPLIRGRCGQRLQISLYELNSKISFPSQIPLSRNVFCHSPIHSNWRTSLQMISFIVFQIKISQLQHLIRWLCKLHSVQQYIQLACCQGNNLWALWAIVATRLDTR